MTSGGSAMAGPIWTKSIQAFLGNSPAETFTQPSGVTKAPACTASGGSYEEYFISGTVPRNNCKTAEPETPVQKDSDGDGVLDNKDNCPNVAGSSSNQGCPVEEQEPTDSDNDGVVDSDDQCDDTPSGVDVDNDGCPVVQEELDSDNDGVVDADDLCPNTPAGQIADVDTDGCSPSQQAILPNQPLVLPRRNA